MYEFQKHKKARFSLLFTGLQTGWRGHFIIYGFKSNLGNQGKYFFRADGVFAHFLRTRFYCMYSSLFGEKTSIATESSRVSAL